MSAKFSALEQTHGIRLRAKFRLDWFTLLPYGSEKPQIFGLGHFTVLPVGGNLRKLNTVYNYKPSPIQRHQNRFCTPTPSWRNRAHKL